MARPRRGRPSKGRREEFRISVAARDTLLIHGLCKLHSRDRGEIISATVIVGLHHLDELAQAALTWHLKPAPLPEGLPLGDTADLPAWVKTSVSDGPQRLRLMLPTVYTSMVESTSAVYAPTQFQRASIRSALLWIGLHHIDELPAMLAELDDVQRGLATSQTALAYYSGQLVETGRSTEDMVTAREMLRRAVPIPEIAAETGIPEELLTDIRGGVAPAQSTKGEQLDLMSAV